MPLDTSVASALRFGSEALTLRQVAAGSFNETTQTTTPGTTTDTSTYGLVQLVQTGVDGITVQRGDFEFWLPKTQLDAESVTPTIGNLLLRGSTQLMILELESQPVAGYYRGRARNAG